MVCQSVDDGQVYRRLGGWYGFVDAPAQTDPNSRASPSFIFRRNRGRWLAGQNRGKLTAEVGKWGERGEPTLFHPLLTLAHRPLQRLGSFAGL